MATDEPEVNSSKNEPLQTSLKFAAGYDMLPPVEERAKFNKPVQFIHSYPTGGVEMTGMDRRVQNAVCQIAQDMYAVLSETRRAQIFDDDIRATPMFKTTIVNFINRIEHASKDNARIYDSLRSLRKWEFCLNVMEDRDGSSTIVEKIYNDLLGELRIGETDGLRNGEIGFEIPNGTLRLIVKPFPYATIESAIGNKLGKGSTIGLFENTIRYLTTYSKHTGVLPVEEWVAMLSGQGKYPDRYVDFKRYVLLPAMEQIANTPAIPYTLELIEIKGPRKKTVALQFKLVMKKQASISQDIEPTWPATLIDLLRKVYGFKSREIIELSHVATEKEVQEACKRAASMFAKKESAGETIEHKGRYLRGILRNLQSGKSKSADADLVEDSPVVEFRTLTKSEDELRREFESFQIRRAQEQLNEFDDEELNSLRDKFTRVHADNFSIKSWIDRGWSRTVNGLNSQFAKWIIDSQPEMTRRLLVEAAAKDFEAWNRERFTKHTDR